MPDTCDVSFYKRIVGEDGRSFLSRLDRIEVDLTELDIVDTAITEFERKHDVADWRQHTSRQLQDDQPQPVSGNCLNAEH